MTREQFEMSVKNGDVKEIGERQFQFDDENKFLIGTLEKIKDIESKRWKGKTSKQYTLNTDTGRVSVFLGGAADNRYGKDLILGHKYAIEYLGLKKIGGRNNMHDYRVFDLGKGDLVQHERKDNKAQNQISGKSSS